MKAMVKNAFLIFVVTIFLSGSMLFSIGQKTAYAQPNPNAAEAATVEWIRNLAFDILNLYLARSWPIDLLDRDPAWRPQQVRDEDGREKLDTRQRLLRWDRRPPNEVLESGFIPQVSNENPSQQDTDLFGYVKSNTPSVFVSTTKTKFKDGKRYQPWTPRSSARGIIYQYEIFAPGGIDVNNSFGDRSPWPNQYEVAFPGGIRPECSRTAGWSNSKDLD
ncbi:scabin-related ADP-ribosyltransferase [Paenibacillus apiarius]|uniref:scabin-related ADP-ribosyltransferase n=1 Tax=Paenibacillus apiarius TaxID=46240 RepID=UPI003B3A3BFC